MSSTPYTVTHCQACGQYAPCMQVTFFQNIGVLVMRFSRTTEGLLCKPCIDATFIRSSAISALFGWWGVISFFYTLFTLPLNVVTWGRAQTLPQPSAYYTRMQPPGGAPAGAGGASLPGASSSGAGASGWAGGTAGGFEHAGQVSAGQVSGSRTPSSQVPAGKLPAGKGPDVLGYASLAVAALGFGATILCTLLGLAMMIWPVDDKSADGGLFCMISSAVICGAPGLLGLALGAYRLLAAKKA